MVSVIVPTFDRQSLLERALDSVFAQTAPPAEVLVVDDGSGDGTAEMVRRRFPRASYLWQENRGVSAARNRGLARARGEWIALLDSDDEWAPTKLEEQLAALAASPEHRLCHTEEIWFRGGRRVNPRRRHAKAGGWIFERCLPLCAISPSSVLVHRSVFAEVGGFDETLPACEDYDLWLRVCRRLPVLFLDRPLTVKHGGREDQLSRRVWGLDRFRLRALEKVLLDGQLLADQRAAVLATARGKLEVYLQGARRRGRLAETAALEARWSRWWPAALEAAG